jgi:hypothetical protein
MKETVSLQSKDLLPILIGAVIVDTVTIGMNYGRFIFVSDELTRWYTTCRLSAMMMDVLICVLYVTIGMRLARKMSSQGPIADCLGILAVQIIGDLLFYAFYASLPRGTLVFDIFKDYSKEVHYHALWADALMVLGTYVGAQFAVLGSPDTQLLLLTSAVYVSQYVLYLK